MRVFHIRLGSNFHKYCFRRPYDEGACAILLWQVKINIQVTVTYDLIIRTEDGYHPSKHILCRSRDRIVGYHICVLATIKYEMYVLYKTEY